ncbi:MAG TPA: serine/threonine-protein kinase [Gemmataceae bacterium]|nr:serine/threonine-protein kinase [Gemmataceae bacterium]
MPAETKQAPSEIGDYELLAKIAEGGMGTVYKGRRKSDGLTVAIKIVPPQTAKNAVLMQRFKREFDAARQLDHPNIVKAIEYCGNVPTPFLVMEFVEGESLGQKIEREGRLSEAEAVRIMAQVCQGLHRAHKQGMIHRDVKPDNVLLTFDGVAKLTDLGLVKDSEDEMNLTRTGRGLGTPHFMAPEQFRNAKNADVRCDVYSLGATLYMMVTGKMPFDGCGPLDAWMKKSSNEFPAPRSLAPELSDRLDAAIRRAMSASPEVRPASCREFIEDVTGQSTRAAPTTLSAGDLWYMFYKDDEGENHTVKGTTENIRKAYQDGLLGDASNIRAARTKMGPFQALHTYTEFQDLVAELKLEKTNEAARDTVPVPSEVIRQCVPSAVSNSSDGVRRPAPSTISNVRGDSKGLDATIAYSSSNRIALPGSGQIGLPAPSTPQAGFDWKFWISVFAIAIGLSVLIALFLPKFLK